MAWSEIFKIYGAGRGNIKKKFNGKIMDRNCDYGDVNGHKSVPILNCKVFQIGIKIYKQRNLNLLPTPLLIL